MEKIQGAKLIDFITNLVRQIVHESKEYDGWFGLVGIVAVAVAAMGTFFVARHQTRKGGVQRRGEARLAWADKYSLLATQIATKIEELENLNRQGAPHSRALERVRIQAKAMAVEILIMVNPDSNDDAGRDEGRMENDLCDRLSRLGVYVDRNYVAHHRKVLKHNWARIKKEF